MASKTISWDGENKNTSLTYDETLNWDRNLWASVISQIPHYSKITNVTLTVTFWSSDTRGKHKFRIDDNTTGKSTVLSEGGVTNALNKTTKNMSLSSVTNMSGYNAGYVNGDIRLNFYRGTLYVPYYYYIGDIGISWTFTYPTYTIKATAGAGGTVSGNTGTFDVTTSNQTKTIKATANSGYKFVKWVDNNGNTVSTNASYSITFSHNTISANATTVTYTAVFEEISGVNNIYIGTSKPKAIYVGTTPVKAVYVGTTLIYQV